MGDEYDINFGGVVPTDVDFSRSGLSDAEIAARMQAEEYNPNPSTHAEFMSHEIKDPYDVKFHANLQKDMDSVRDRAMQQQRDALAAKNKEIENRNKEVEAMRQEKEALKRERDLEREKLLVEQRANQLRPYIVRTPTTISYDGYDGRIYNRLYDWSLGLIPDYYTYTQRRQLESTLERLIKKELSDKRSESELEDKIRNIMASTPKEEATKSQKEPKTQRVKTPKRKQSKKKSSKKKSSKRKTSKSKKSTKSKK